MRLNRTVSLVTLALGGIAPAATAAAAPETPTIPEMLTAPVPSVGQAATPAEAEKQPAPPAPRLTYGGSADFYFSTNLNKPFTGTNALRAWDVKDEHGPHLGLIDLWGQYARGPVGGRLDLNFGPTSRYLHAFDPNQDDVWHHIQQAYVSANLNRRGTTYVDAGKWVTTAGVEVTEPRDNWLYSRGLLFNLVQPFYHLGARGYHYFNDTDNVMVAVHRGYNAVGSTGRGLGFALAGTKKLTPEWTFTGNYYGGEEAATAGAAESYRSLVDLILLYAPEGSRWSYTFNADYAQQGSTRVGGLSMQARYALNPRSYLAARGEFLLDDDFLGSDVYSLTLGYGHQVNKYLQGRAEFRYDWASQRLFADERRDAFTSNQPTFLISAIVSY